MMQATGLSKGHLYNVFSKTHKVKTDTLEKVALAFEDLTL
jgi:hypothetical protein